MSENILNGVNGSNPLGFLASLGLLRLATARDAKTRLRFLDDGTYRAVIETEAPLIELVVDDAKVPLPDRSWYLSYEKAEKNGVKHVADLKAPPAQFRLYLEKAVEAWTDHEQEWASYAASFGTSVVQDKTKGNTKPTALHFTGGNQQFLASVDALRAEINSEWIQESLLRGGAVRPGGNVRWDPTAERNWALMAENPNNEGTRVDAPLEWLAFRGMVFLPTFPVQAPPSFRDPEPRIVTTAVFGRTKSMELVWPLWNVHATLAVTRSLVQLDWQTPGTRAERARSALSIFAVCNSVIRDGDYRSFSPASVGT